MLTDSQRVEQKDKAVREDIKNEDFQNHLFIRLIAKDRRFTKVDFKYTVFDGCYLRNCVFDSCDFTGCRFLSTNLVGSSFPGCKFDYATFERTLVDIDLLETGCPGHENLKMRFARSLRMNFQQLGDAKAANRAIAIELEATDAHLYKAWRSPESYYRKKYKGWPRIVVFAQWIEFRILDFVWGNGENLKNLVRFCLLFMIGMAVVDVFRFRNPNSISDYLSALLDAPSTFIGVSKPDRCHRPKYLDRIEPEVNLVFGAMNACREILL